jgi:hypothetical protein
MVKNLCISCRKRVQRVKMFPLVDMPVCKDCLRSKERYAMVTQTDALAYFRGLTREDLATLPFKPCPTPYSRSRVGKLFLVRDIRGIVVDRAGGWNQYKALEAAAWEKKRKRADRAEAKKKEKDLELQAAKKVQVEAALSAQPKPVLPPQPPRSPVV